MITRTLKIATPAGVLQADWDEDESIPVEYSGPAAAIEYFKSHVTLNMLRGDDGYRLTPDALEPDEVIRFCQPEGSNVSVLLSAEDMMDQIRQETTMAEGAALDSASGAEFFELIGEGAQIMRGLDEDSPKFFDDLGRLREILALIGDPEPEPTGPWWNNEKRRNEVLETVRPFMSESQFRVVASNASRGEEKEFFREKLLEVANTIKGMPKTYDQDGKGMQSVAHLHYFKGSADWYITEKDKEGGVDQAFGWADLFGDGGELGYISIAEIVGAGVELDLYFKPATLASLLNKDEPAPDEGAAPQPGGERADPPVSPGNPTPGASDGEAAQGEVDPDYAEAMAYMQSFVESRADVLADDVGERMAGYIARFGGVEGFAELYTAAVDAYSRDVMKAAMATMAR